MDNLENEIKLYSEEIKDILSTPPRSIFRWGNSLLLLFFIVFFTVSYFVKYPDTVTGKMKIISYPSYQTLTIDEGQNVDTLFVKNREKITKNSAIGVLKSSANYEDILKLKEAINLLPTEQIKIPQLPHYESFPILGELGKFYHNFYKKAMDFNRESTNEETYDNLMIEQKILRNKIQLWEDKFVFKSKMDGKVFYPKSLKNTSGRVNVYVVPSKIKSFSCIINIKKNDLHKIKIGQQVIITIEGYYHNHKLKGKISKIPVLSSNGKEVFIVEASLSKDLLTDKGEKILFNGDIQGNAKVITEDLRFIERVFYNLRNVLNKK